MLACVLVSERQRVCQQHKSTYFRFCGTDQLWPMGGGMVQIFTTDRKSGGITGAAQRLCIAQPLTNNHYQPPRKTSRKPSWGAVNMFLSFLPGSLCIHLPSDPWGSTVTLRNTPVVAANKAARGTLTLIFLTQGDPRVSTHAVSHSFSGHKLPTRGEIQACLGAGMQFFTPGRGDFPRA